MQRVEAVDGIRVEVGLVDVVTFDEHELAWLLVAAASAQFEMRVKRFRVDDAYIVSFQSQAAKLYNSGIIIRVFLVVVVIYVSYLKLLLSSYPKCFNNKKDLN